MNTRLRAYRAAPAITLGALPLSTLVTLGDPIDRSELHVKDGDTVIVGPGGERHMKDQEYRLLPLTRLKRREVSALPRLRRAIVRPLSSSSS
jgi:hypothetical protein